MARGAEAGIDLTFHNPRDELAFYWSTGKASLTWARWQRLLCGTVWSLQCFKLVLLSVQLPLARARLLWVLAFTATTVCLEFSAAVLSLLRPSWSILHHETIKVAVQLCNCTTVLVGVFMSNPEDYLIKSPLAAMLCLAAVQVFGQMRLATAANVYPIAAAMHALMQISQWATEAPGAATSHPIGNILTHLLLGVALPVMASGAMEARCVHGFILHNAYDNP
ncbi:hypothetical protein WJX72_004624 [[Myrmecia] bisecta]|uniref:Uncharacterized protein n=1 Tax=[Myrmecia] bisecta TaxID=41462 RepID=A0AAW1QQF2_9CHLO